MIAHRRTLLRAVNGVLRTRSQPNLLIARQTKQSTEWRCLSTSAGECKSENSRILKELAYKIEENEEVAEKVGKALSREIAAQLQTAMEKVNVAAGTVQAPSRRDLLLVGLANAIPFIGFGFMDNAIMILAGEAIDAKFGVVFGMSTMAAAAYGNWVSDLSGLWLGGVVETLAQKLGVPQPNLSRAQLALPRARRAANIGSALGVSLGCVLGMFPLLLIDTKKAQREKEASQEQMTLFEAVNEEVSRIMQCRSATLYLVDEENKSIYTKQRQYLSIEEEEHAVGLSKICSKVAETGVPLKISASEAIYGESVLCTPAFDSSGHVVGVLEARGKMDGRGRPADFDAADEQKALLLASHVSTTVGYLRLSHGAAARGRGTGAVREGISLIHDKAADADLEHDDALTAYRTKLSLASARDIEPADISLMIAAEKGELARVRVFLEKGAYVNVRDGLSRTPLHLAACQGHLAVVDYLLDKGANPFIVDQRTESPLAVAERKGNEVVSDHLRKHMEMLRTKALDKISRRNKEERRKKLQQK